jgi:periplasmic protein CpxP/Spy
MSKTAFLKWAVAALVLLNLGTIAFFFTQKRPPHHVGPRKVIVDRLHFDAAQIAEYEKLIERHQTSIKQKEQNISVAKSDLYVLLQGADFSKKDSLIARIGAFQMEIEAVHFDHFQEIKSICKPAQLGDFNALTSELARFFGKPELRDRKESPIGK